MQYKEQKIRICSNLPLHRQSGVPGKVCGALRIANQIKRCIPILHSPVGCAFQRKINTFAPYEITYNLPCTNLTEVDTVYGGHEKLVEKVLEVNKKYHPELILIISTCAPDLIGEDYDITLDEVRDMIDAKIIYDTGNAKRAPVGMQSALYSLATQVMEEQEKIEKSLNICKLSYHRTDSVDEFVDILEEMGAHVNGVYFNDNTVEDIKNIPRAELNLVDFPADWVLYAEKKFGMKYLMPPRLKIEDSLTTLNGFAKYLYAISDVLDLDTDVIEKRKKEADEKLEKYRNELKGKKIASGFSVHGGAMQTLIEDVGMECPVLILKTRRMNLMMKDDAVKHISNSMTRFIENHQGYAPEVLINPTTEEEIKAMKEHGIELCVGGMENNMFEYLRNGIKLFDMRRMMQISKMGFSNSVNIARETYKIVSKEPKSHLLLGNMDYSMKNPSLSNYWADIVDVFQTCWYCECKD